MLKEFKEFALKGNVVDLAVGVIIGGAFGQIVNSLVADLIMPVFSLITSGIDFKDMKYVVGDVTFGYGNFIQNVVNFLIISFSIFLAVKFLNKMRRKEEVKPEPAKPAAPSEAQLLTEIRDLLKSKQA